MLKQVMKTIRQQALLKQGDRVLVALSGGADSVCLLDALLYVAKDFSVTVSAAHLNHCLRGSEADGDEAFVISFCKERNVPLFSHRQNVKALAEERGMTLEEAGRHARYAFFNKLAAEQGFTKIATAHNANDNAETVLMHFLRGASVDGMAGIPYRNGLVIRPLLEVSRQKIEAYAEARGLSYRTDSTNKDTEFTRNRIRHELMPRLEKDYNPALVDTLLTNAKNFAACRDFVQEETAERFKRLAKPVSGGYAFNRGELLRQSPYMIQSLLRRALCQVAQGKEIGAVLTERTYEILQKGSGAQCITSGVTASVHHENLYIRRETPAASFCYLMPRAGRLWLVEAGAFLEIFRESGGTVTVKPHEACFDAERLAGKTLRVRSRQAGDVFYPVGMTGKKTVREFFIDKKIPRFLRESVPIITADEDIIWVAGLRADRRYIAKEGCSKVLRLQFLKGEQHEQRY